MATLVNVFLILNDPAASERLKIVIENKAIPHLQDFAVSVVTFDCRYKALLHMGLLCGTCWEHGGQQLCPVDIILVDEFNRNFNTLLSEHDTTNRYSNTAVKLLINRQIMIAAFPERYINVQPSEIEFHRSAIWKKVDKKRERMLELENFMAGINNEDDADDE